MNGPDRKDNYRSSDPRNQNRQYRQPYNKGQRRNSRRSRSRSNVYIRKGVQLYLLDILQHGGVDKAGHSWHPICQIIEVPSFRLLEVNLNKKLIPELKLQQKIIYQGTDESPLGRVNKVLKYEDLTPASETTLEFVLEAYVTENEKVFVDFVNNAGPITLKRHSLEILPGVGKKLMWEIINHREKQPFTSFEDIHENVPGFKPVDVFARRIFEEISDPDQKRFLFVKRHTPHPDQHGRDSPHHDSHSHNRPGDPYHRRH